MEENWDKKLADVGEMREGLQRQINELKHVSDPLRHSIDDTGTALIRQKTEVQLLYGRLLRVLTL